MSFLAQIIHGAQRAAWVLGRPITLGVRVLLIQDGQVLLVQHRYGRKNVWYLPGGGVKRRETPEQAIRREAREEVGATLEDLRLFGVFSNFSEGKSDHVLIFSCTAFALATAGDWEITRFRFFPMTQPPPDVSPGTLRRIEDYLTKTPPVWGRW
jgi:8-oxo-dGTP pyrophosphatase MutT (NUDIX family)